MVAANITNAGNTANQAIAVNILARMHKDYRLIAMKPNDFGCGPLRRGEDLFQPLDLCSCGLQLFLDFFVAPVEMVDAIDHRESFGYERRDD